MDIHILSGVPGSGKSTIANRIACNHFKQWPEDDGLREVLAKSIICSADDYYMKDGVYVYDASKIGRAHATCLRKFNSLLHEKAPVIIVDNTNVEVGDIAPYYAFGEAFDYRVNIYTVICEPDIAYLRCLHSVRHKTIQSMCDRIKRRKLPHWWKEEQTCLKGNSCLGFTDEEREAHNVSLKKKLEVERTGAWLG